MFVRTMPKKKRARVTTTLTLNPKTAKPSVSCIMNADTLCKS